LNLENEQDDEDSLNEGLTSLVAEIVRISQEIQNSANQSAVFETTPLILFTQLSENLKSSLLRILGPFIDSW
jgi:hypothetical protein